MFRLVVFADTHLRKGHGRHQRNFSRAVRKAGEFNLAVVAGDLSVDGADQKRDLDAAHQRFSALPHPWRAIPGNHDIGVEPGSKSAKQPVSHERRNRYRAVFGDDFWVQDVPGWRLVGLNVHIFGTGWEAEAVQWQILEDAISARGSRRVGVFIHKPLFLNGPDDREDLHNCVTAGGRQRLLELAEGGNGIAFFTSGHHHQCQVRLHEGVHHIWAPATANPAKNVRAANAIRTMGFAWFELGPEGRFRTGFDFI